MQYFHHRVPFVWASRNNSQPTQPSCVIKLRDRCLARLAAGMQRPHVVVQAVSGLDQLSAGHSLANVRRHDREMAAD